MKKNKDKKIKNTIGGQALLEGVMMRGKTALAMAVRSDDGEVLIETERVKPPKKTARLPIIRGIVSFISSLILGINTITRSANAISEEEEQLGKGATAIAIILGLLLAIGLFFLLPSFLAGLFYDYVAENIIIKNLISGVVRVSIFIIYLALVSKMKDIRRTFMYHGAEHKTINCFEKGLPLTIENVQSCSTRHNRCGTTFLFLVMIISIFVFAFVDYGLTKLLPMDKGLVRNFSYMGIKLLFLPLVAGLSYEVLFAFARLPDNKFTLVLRAPGLALQKLTTKQPDDEMVDVAIQSFLAVYELEQDPSKKTYKFEQIPMEKVYKILDESYQSIDADNAEKDWLLCAVTDKKRSQLLQLSYLSRKEFKELKQLLKKRQVWPLDYCLGVTNFYGYDIFVDSRVLIPRMETELLCETAIKTIGDNHLSVLDLCTGSGCIALVLAKKTNAKVVAVDISDAALAVAAKNLSGTDVELIKSDMFYSLTGKTFDVIVCNPPYVRTDEILSLQPEVRCQPHLALDGGEDGMDFYRILARDARKHINKDGYLIIEVGFGQADLVGRMLAAIGGFDQIEIIKDYGGIDRIIKAKIGSFKVSSLDKNNK